MVNGISMETFLILALIFFEKKIGHLPTSGTRLIFFFLKF
jgi:hypothetical protein